MAAHTSKEGAFGYVLNRPLEQRVADLLPDQSLGALGQVLHWNRKQGTLRCQTHLSVTDALHELSMGHDVRGFVGYSGWAEGQIEKEIKHRSWIVTESRKTILTAKPASQMWKVVLEEMGPVYQLMANTPDKVELN